MDIMSVALMIKEIGAEAVRDALEKLGISARDTAQDLGRVDRAQEEAADSAKRMGNATKNAKEETSFFARAIGNVSDELKGMAAGFGAVMIVQKFIEETSNATIAQAQLEAVLKSTNFASGQTVESLNAHASALAQLTAFEDDAITSAQVLLASFNRISGDTFPKATQAVLDLASMMAAGTGGVPDLKGAAIQVGKALQDPILGVTALSRAGVTFTEAQKAQIKALVESNDLLAAQGLVLAELRTQTEGQATAVRNTFGGAVQGLINEVNNLFELSDTNAGKAAQTINVLAAALNGLGVVLTDSKLVNGFGKLLEIIDKMISAMPMVLLIKQGIAKLATEGGGIPTPPPPGATPAPSRVVTPPPPMLPPSAPTTAEAAQARAEKIKAEAERRFADMLKVLSDMRNISEKVRRDQLALEAKIIKPAAVDVGRVTVSPLLANLDAARDAMTAEYKEKILDPAKAMTEQFKQTLVAGIANAFQALAARGGNIGDAFKAFGQTVLSGVGDMLIQLGTMLLKVAPLLQGIRDAFASLNPYAMAAAAVGLIALGGAMKGAASRIATSGMGAPVSAGGFGYATAGGSSGITLPGLSYMPTTASSMGARVMAQQPVNVTVIGPNDPSAQRAIQELITNANRRGNTFAV